MVVEKLCIPVSRNWQQKEDTKKDVQLDGDDNKNKKKVDDTDCEKEDQDSIEQVCLLWNAICIKNTSYHM